ncbi:hypothetical protein LTR41_006978 [Exophiala xenobiotica]|nr:hypothetical protein LTR41_006978 [Exophiala xenobiotica]KAK5317848.1 hypothetical protein LTR93_008489 [Exophiala xenobiotica]KAK5410101.1 hypothetical protein LTR06_006567 [Exophiala xenobiotica]
MTGQLSPELRRPSLRIRRSTTSGASSVPSTPLDEIPKPLWPRTVIRTSSTPEASNPELSIDEITSTKLSLDDEAFLTSLPYDEHYKHGKTWNFGVKKGIADIWEDNSGRLKKMTKTLRQLPNGFFARKDRASTSAAQSVCLTRPFTSEPTLPQQELMTESCVPQSMDPTGDQEHEGLNSEPLLRAPPHFKSAPRYYTYAPSSSTIHTAEDRLLHGPRSFKIPDRQLPARSSSVGSVEELRSHAFGAQRSSRPSISNVSVGHNSAPSISRSIQQGSRPGTISESGYSVSGTTVVPKPVVFMDASSACADITWNNGYPNARPSTSSTARPASKGAVCLHTQDDSETLPTVSPEIEIGRGDFPDWKKIPLFVPRSVERKDWQQPARRNCPSTILVPPHSAIDGTHGNGVHSEVNVSSPAISDMSFASLQGQTSIQSHLDREAMILDWESEVEEQSSPSGRERLSKVLCNAWAEGTTRLRQKGAKRVVV